jgi:hypothetical protein
MADLTDAERQAGTDALNAWAQPQIANASIFERGAIQSYLAAHGPDMVTVIGGAIKDAVLASQTTGDTSAST